MALVRQNGGLIKKSGALGRADNAFNVCCCGGCPTCPDLCGYYIEAQAGGATYYPLKEGSDERVTSNDTFCAEEAYLYYPRPGRPQFVVVTETEGTPGLPSACGLGTSDVEYTGSGSTSIFLMTSTIAARLAVGDGVEDEPRAQASLGLSCSNGVWTATVNWQVNRFVGGSLVQCSARKIFPIRTGCQEDTTCEVPPGEGANIHGRVFTVTGNGVTVSGIGTIPFDDDDREGDCSGNACLSAWRSLWQARFQVYRVSCSGVAAGACCQCGAVLFDYPYQYVELFGQTSWDTEEEANAAADIAVGYVENMADIMLANGYCDALVAIQNPRVRSFFAPWLDPPRTLWELAQPLAQIFGRCCGFTRIDVPISEMWPGTNTPIFGNRGACVDDGSNVTCAECGGCEDNPCCTFHPGQTCEEEPCNPLP